MIPRALRRAWLTYWRHLPDMLRYTLLMLIIHLIPLAPALCLLEKALYPGLIACPLLFLLVVLPVRQNAAAVMQQALRGGRMFDLALVSFADYGRKLGACLVRTLLLLLWALPALAATGSLLWLNSLQGVAGQTDFFTLMRYARDFGGGDMWRGLVYMALIYAALWLPLIFGCAFHSGARHAAALGRKGLMRGHHGKQLVTYLVAQCTLQPWLAVMCVPVSQYIGKLMDALRYYDFSGLVPDAGMLLIAAGATLVLLLPVLPLRDLMIAALPAQIYDRTEARA